MKRLTQKQHQFALAYVETGNRVEAYRRAYNRGRMTERTVSRKAQEVAALSHVAAEIGALQEQAVCRNKLTVDDLVREYRRIAFSSIADFINVKDGAVTARTMAELSPDQKACVRKLKVHPDGRVECELHDKVQALNQLAKDLGMFEKRKDEGPPVLINLNMGCPPEDEDMPRQVPNRRPAQLGKTTSGPAAM